MPTVHVHVAFTYVFDNPPVYIHCKEGLDGYNTDIYVCVNMYIGRNASCTLGDFHMGLCAVRNQESCGSLI